MTFPKEIGASITVFYSTDSYIDFLDDNETPTIEGFRKFMRDELIEDLGTADVVLNAPTSD